MSLHPTPIRPRPEDRRRGDAEPAPVWCGAGQPPPWLRSEAFAEDLAEPVGGAVPGRPGRAAAPWRGQLLGLLRAGAAAPMHPAR